MYDPDEKCSIMAEAIKKFCKEKSITLYALAKAAGISTSTISYLVNGKTNPQIYTVLLICNVLDVTIGELIDDNLEDDSERSSDYPENGRTAEEEKLVEKYRCLSERKKDLLKVYLDMLMQYK